MVTSLSADMSDVLYLSFLSRVFCFERDLYFIRVLFVTKVRYSSRALTSSLLLFVGTELKKEQGGVMITLYTLSNDWASLPPFSNNLRSSVVTYVVNLLMLPLHWCLMTV